MTGGLGNPAARQWAIPPTIPLLSAGEAARPPQPFQVRIGPQSMCTKFDRR